MSHEGGAPDQLLFILVTEFSECLKAGGSIDEYQEQEEGQVIAEELQFKIMSIILSCCILYTSLHSGEGFRTKRGFVAPK